MTDGLTLAVIDVGTVTTRLFVARTGEGGAVEPLERTSTIVNLGQGVDAAGRLAPEAIGRTLTCVRAYGARIGELASQGHPAEAVTITLTSAARDAANATDLLEPLIELGLKPQVIDGMVEARLSLLGVTGDFLGTPLLMADSGGGSTELALGLREPDGRLTAGAAHSFDVGCRRVTERFLGDPTQPPAPEAIAAARDFARRTLSAFFSSPSAFAGPGTPAVAPKELVCVGGTATSLVSVAHKLVPYDPSFVHLHRMSRQTVGELAAALLSLGAADRRRLPGLQPKRADVIAAGALILDELMDVSGFDSYVASERDSLYGLLACEQSVVLGRPGPVAPLWEAKASDAMAFARACVRGTDGKAVSC